MASQDLGVVPVSEATQARPVAPAREATQARPVVPAREATQARPVAPVRGATRVSGQWCGRRRRRRHNRNFIPRATIKGIVRVVIAKRDTQRNLCLLLVLDQPGSNPWALSLPQSWGVETAAQWTDTSSCLSRLPPTGSILANGGTGMASFTQGAGQSMIDVSILLTFPAADGGAPTSQQLSVQALDVHSACQL